MISKTCTVSGQTFEITDDDLQFYEKMDVPPPTLCPEERHRRRHGWINDYKFYRRKCDITGKYFMSIFPSDSEYRVISPEAFISESRDDKAEGRDFDFSRPFFQQFDELMHEAPQLGIIGMNNENCDYCESVANCKSCYLISESSNCEDCLYCYWIQKCKSCLDLSYCHECEWCYQCTHAYHCYETFYSEDCEYCSHSYFLRNCSNCKDCIGCINLRQKQYNIFNKPYSKKAYEKLVEDLDFSSRSSVAILRKKCHDFWATQPQKYLQIQQTENTSGNYIRNAKNCHNVYHCYDAENCAYGEHIWRDARYCYDSNTAGRNSELLYETTNCGIDSYNVIFCRYCWSCKDVLYSNGCGNCEHIFGCTTLKPQSKFCILNKTYSQEDYFALKEKIIAHMKKTGEWGQFFPLALSLFGYNNSVSGDEMPLTEKEALNRGYKWQEKITSEKYDGPTYKTPDKLEDAAPDISEKIITCTETDKHFRIIPQEIKFYQKLKIPLPDECFQARFRRMLDKSWPMRKSWSTKCHECQKAIQTTFAPDRPEKVLCEGCYLTQVQ